MGIIEYYVWPPADPRAQAALDYINGTSWFPVIGRNAKTKAYEPNKQKTTKWCEEVSVRNGTDNSLCFPKIPDVVLDAVGVPEEDRQAFLDTFQPTIEEYQDGWFVEEE